MKAVYFDKHGGLDVLQYGDVVDPVVKDGQVLIDVKACALNHLDIWQRQGLPGISIPMPHISGSDVCGLVREVGVGVKRFKKGDRVIVSPGQLPVGVFEGFEARDSYSPQFHILGLQSQGGYAEKVVVDERWVIPVSERYSYEEWASFPLVSVTAYHMLVTRAELKAGETVLIHAAGSGVGSIAIQLARHLGAKVYTTVGDIQKVLPAKKLGAHEVIEYRKEDFSEKIKQLTGGGGVDVVVDHIGAETWPKNIASLCRGGRMATCGSTCGPKTELELRPIFSKQISILGSYMGSFAELLKMIDLIEKGVILPVIDQIAPLREAAAAQQRMESRSNFGKIVLKV